MREISEKDRLSYLGSTWAGAIQGVSPYKSKWLAWAYYTGRKEYNVPLNWAMERGIALESVILAKTEESFGVKIDGRQEFVQNKQYPWLAGHIDGRSGSTLFEVKTTNSFRSKQFDEDEQDIPADYLMQICHFMACDETFQKVMVCVDDSMKIKYIEYTREELQPLIDDYIKNAVDFWRMVEEDIEPPLSMSSDDVKNEFKEAKYDDIVTIEDEEYQSLAAIVNLKVQKKQIETLIADYEAKIKQLIGDHGGVIIGDTKFTWKNNKSSVNVDYDAMISDNVDLAELYQKTQIDAIAMAKDNPELAASYTTEVPGSRAFRISKK